MSRGTARGDGFYLWLVLWSVAGLGKRSCIRKQEEEVGEEGEKYIEDMIQGEEDFKK